MKMEDKNDDTMTDRGIYSDDALLDKKSNETYENILICDI